MPSKFSLQQISSLDDRDIFFDANILIYLFWPTGSQYWENQYSFAYARLINQKNKLLVDYLVIAEVINVALKAEYKKFLLQNSITQQSFSYKNFRNSHDGQSAVNDVYSMIKYSILDMFDVVEKTFSRNDMDVFLSYDSLDFNDKAILSICKQNNFVLITNDKDFITSEIDILTGNSTLLQHS